MFRFALKNMATKRLQLLLIVFSVMLSAGVAVLAYNTAEQVSDGISGTAGYYSAIVGPAGSKTQLAMNTMYFTDEPLGTVPYSVVSALQQDPRVNEVIPYAMADSYNGFSVVGTGSAFLGDKALLDGRLFSDDGTFEVVMGWGVAHTCGISVGDEIYTSHAVGEEHKTPLTVVGILERTHTAYDNVVFTELRSIWEIHEHGEEEEHGEEHDHEEMHGMICAALIRTKNPTYAMTLVSEYDGRTVTDPDGDTFTLQAIEPMSVVRGVLEEANSTKYIVFVLCAIILLMNLVIITVITLLNMYHSSKEISLMRLIGIGMGRINLLYLIQNSLIGAASAVLAFGLSRLCLVLMQDYVSSMGVVLNVGKVYPAEFAVLFGVFLITVLPTVICTARMARKKDITE